MVGEREMARFFLGSSNNLKHTAVLLTIISISIISIIFIISISINLRRTILLTTIPIGLPMPQLQALTGGIIWTDLFLCFRRPALFDDGLVEKIKVHQWAPSL